MKILLISTNFSQNAVTFLTYSKCFTFSHKKIMENFLNFCANFIKFQTFLLSNYVLNVPPPNRNSGYASDTYLAIILVDSQIKVICGNQYYIFKPVQINRSRASTAAEHNFFIMFYSSNLFIATLDSCQTFLGLRKCFLKKRVIYWIWYIMMRWLMRDEWI